MNYSELISTLQTLYNDLQSCDAIYLVDLSSPALKFITTERFQQCNNWLKKTS